MHDVLYGLCSSDIISFACTLWSYLFSLMLLISLKLRTGPNLQWNHNRFSVSVGLNRGLRCFYSQDEPWVQH